MNYTENANTITAREFYEVQVEYFLDFVMSEADKEGKYTDGNEELFEILAERTGATDGLMARMLYSFVGGFLKGFEVANKLFTNN